MVRLSARADRKGFYSHVSSSHVQCLTAKRVHLVCGLCTGAISIKKSTALVQDVGAIVDWSWGKQLGQLSHQLHMCASIQQMRGVIKGTNSGCVFHDSKSARCLLYFNRNSNPGNDIDKTYESY